MNPSAQLANPSPGHSFFIAGPQVGPRRRICGLNALHSPREAQVDEEDIVRLDSGAWMNDRLVNYYLWLIAASYYERGSQPSEFTFLPSDVFQNWYKDEHLLDVHKVVHTNPILSQFIAMPCNIDNHHWILLIVAYPSDLVTLSPHPPSRACALYFDSYPGAIDSRLKRVIHQKVQRLLAQLITQLPSATTKGHPVNLPAVYPKVPAQQNDQDCGLVCMHFLDRFVKSPLRLLDYCKGTSPNLTSRDEIWRKDMLGGLRGELLADIRTGWMYEERGRRWSIRTHLSQAYPGAELEIPAEPIAEA